MIGALILCLVIAVAVVLVIRMRSGASSGGFLTGSRRLILVETVRLPNHASVSIIACDGEEMLFSTSQQETRFIGLLPMSGAQQHGAADEAS